MEKWIIDKKGNFKRGFLEGYEHTTNKPKNISGFNCTQLDPDKSFDKHIYHRDQFSHYLRWTHVLKNAKIGQTVLDMGCGTGNLAEVFYRNRFKLKKYVGFDYKESSIIKAKEKLKGVPWANFYKKDLTSKDFNLNTTFDIITSFEVIEHIGVDNAEQYLLNIKKHCNNSTKILLSTPVYDPKISCANNHITNGEVNEFFYDELKELIEKVGFKIINNFGTFASQKDYKSNMKKEELNIFNRLSKYYDTNILSVLFAPLYPKLSRNVLWTLSI